MNRSRRVSGLKRSKAASKAELSAAVSGRTTTRSVALTLLRTLVVSM
jgi:hypothetical protein